MKLAMPWLVIFGLLSSSMAHAVEYYELEVYGYEMPGLHELEMENATSMSSDDGQAIDNRILRSTFEMSYGWNDRFESTAYLDYTQPVNDSTEYTAFRAHARTRFAEMGEWPVDLGAYFEVELPRNYAQKDMGFEFRPIIEKSFSRWTLRLNPQVEVSHVAVSNQPGVIVIDPDEAPAGNAPVTGDKQWVTEYGVASSVLYSLSSHYRPHLDWYYGFNDQTSLLMPTVDMNLMRGLKVSAGMGFGMTPNTEQRLLMARLEYELYLF